MAANVATPIRARGMLNDIARAPLAVHMLESMCTSARSWAAWGGRGWLGKTVLLIRHSKILWTVGQRLFVKSSDVPFLLIAYAGALLS